MSGFFELVVNISSGYFELVVNIVGIFLSKIMPLFIFIMSIACIPTMKVTFFPTMTMTQPITVEINAPTATNLWDKCENK